MTQEQHTDQAKKSENDNLLIIHTPLNEHPLYNKQVQDLLKLYEEPFIDQYKLYQYKKITFCQKVGNSTIYTTRFVPSIVADKVIKLCKNNILTLDKPQETTIWETYLINPYLTLEQKLWSSYQMVESLVGQCIRAVKSLF